MHALVLYVLLNVSGICLCRTNNALLSVILVMWGRRHRFSFFFPFYFLPLSVFSTPQNLLWKIGDVAECLKKMDSILNPPQLNPK